MTNNEFEQGYTNALMELQNNLRLDKAIPTSALDKVLKHIQDLIRRCNDCGGWLFSDGSCLTCERSKLIENTPKKRAAKK
jgi:hypothetical protein